VKPLVSYAQPDPEFPLPAYANPWWGQSQCEDDNILEQWRGMGSTYRTLWIDQAGTGEVADGSQL
jgi:hypothetical protein